MWRRWRLTGFAVACGILLAVTADSPRSAAAFLALFLVVGAALSPRAFPRSLTVAEAQRRSAHDGRPIVYWRPGCPYCLRLRARLGRAARRLHWVDIWADPAGAAALRALTGGNETVPTLSLSPTADRDPLTLINPTPAQVKAVLATGARAPRRPSDG